MPPRRSHKKSKAGCQRCKHRKIKCDEVHPKCGNCSKHGVPCDFESSQSPVSGSSTSKGMVESPNSYTDSSPGTSSTIVPFYRTPLDVIKSNANPASSRSLELKLMHHYTALTSDTLSSCEAQRVAWRVDVPTMAYNAPYLMDAILAVSALHLRALNPEDYSFVKASHSYMASALAQYSSLLRDGVSATNAEALFATAALIAFQSSASRGYDNPDGAYSPPLAWFHSFQGVKTVVMASWQWLKNSDRIRPIISGQPALVLNLNPDATTFFAPLLGGVDNQIETLSAAERAETKRSYEHAVAFLNWAHKKPDRARILGFAATVSRRFVELVGQHDPRALVIISCFFAMTKVVDDVWWLDGLAKREVTGIFTLLPHEWWGKMEWPLRIANHEGPMDDTVWGVSWAEAIKEEESDVSAHIDMLAAIMNECAPPMPPD